MYKFTIPKRYNYNYQTQRQLLVFTSQFSCLYILCTFLILMNVTRFDTNIINLTCPEKDIFIVFVQLKNYRHFPYVFGSFLLF